MAGLSPEKPIPHSPEEARGRRFSPDAQQVVVSLNTDTIMTLSGILWSMTVDETVASRKLGLDYVGEDSVDTSRLLARVQSRALSITDVSRPITMGLSGNEIDALNLRLQLLSGYDSVNPDARESFMSAFRDINEAFVKAGQSPRPDYVDFLRSENRQ